MRIARFTGLAAVALALSLAHASLAWAEGFSIYHATLMEPDAKTGEVSTEQLRRILGDGSAITSMRGLVPSSRPVISRRPRHRCVTQRAHRGRRADRE